MNFIFRFYTFNGDWYFEEEVYLTAPSRDIAYDKAISYRDFKGYEYCICINEEVIT